MNSVEKKPANKIWRIVSLSIPSLIAIALIELVNAEIYLYGPVSDGSTMFILWNILQIIPAFVFGYISDRNYRKQMLVISQALGFFGGIVLFMVGAKTWVLILIAMTFNPLPIARAALLDNFPQFSTLKLVAVTFLAQNLPWVFFKQLSYFSMDSLVLITLFLIASNLVLTSVLFEDRRDLIHPKAQINNSWEFVRNDGRLLYTLLAFTLSEMTFYIIWVYIEYSKGNAVWLDLTTFATLVGILIVMLYTRLPHMSIITLLYSIGFALSLVALLTCGLSVFSCEVSLLSAMSHYSVMGGIYFPFVTDAVIKMFGPNNKAVGSAMVEFGDTIAIFIAPFFNLIFKPSPTEILWILLALYLLATGFQKMAERSRVKIID